MIAKRLELRIRRTSWHIGRPAVQYFFGGIGLLMLPRVQHHGPPEDLGNLCLRPTGSRARERRDATTRFYPAVTGGRPVLHDEVQRHGQGGDLTNNYWPGPNQPEAPYSRSNFREVP